MKFWVIFAVSSYMWKHGFETDSVKKKKEKGDFIPGYMKLAEEVFVTQYKRQ